MPDADPLRIKKLIERRIRAAAIRRRLFYLLLIGGIVGWAAKRWADEQEVFVVQTIRLEVCPDHLREAAANQLQPLLGHTFFEVAAQRQAMVQKLARLPEVRGAELVCRPPDAVSVKLIPRIPLFAVEAGKQWLSVDDEAVIVRVTAKPEAGLCEVLGVRPALVTPGAHVAGQRLRQAADCLKACEAVVGSPPTRIGFEPGGAMRARLANGELVILGQATELERKLHAWLVVRNRLTTPVQYIDVATPTVPAWQPVSES